MSQDDAFPALGMMARELRDGLLHAHSSGSIFVHHGAEYEIAGLTKTDKSPGIAIVMERGTSDVEDPDSEWVKVRLTGSDKIDVTVDDVRYIFDLHRVDTFSTEPFEPEEKTGPDGVIRTRDGH